MQFIFNNAAIDKIFYQFNEAKPNDMHWLPKICKLSTKGSNELMICRKNGKQLYKSNAILEEKV